MIFNRSMSRRRAAIVLGGKDLPSGVRTVSSFTLALRSLGLKLRTPNWIKADFMRLTTRVCSWTNPSRSRCGRLASSSSMVGTIATVQWPRSPRSQPRKPRFNIAVSSRSVFSSPMFAGYGHAGGVDDMRIYAAFPQPASQPEAIAPSLVRHGNPGDRPSGLNCFVPPAMQQFQQVFRVRLQFLQRFPANTRYQPGDQPV